MIFVCVEGALGSTRWSSFRARKGAVAAQIRGNTRLEIGWTVGAAVILLALAVLTFAKLSSIQNPSTPAPTATTWSATQSGLTVREHQPQAAAERQIAEDHRRSAASSSGSTSTRARAEPDGLGAPYSYQKMVVPDRTPPSTLDIVSADVVHSWWIPQLGGKFQAVPGYHNYTWFKIAKPGVYRGQCALMCGRGHARMIATVEAVPPAQFEAWLAHQKQLIARSERAPRR